MYISSFAIERVKANEGCREVMKGVRGEGKSNA